MDGIWPGAQVYDTEGRFVPQKYEEIFSKYDAGNKGGLSWDDIQAMVKGNRNVNDPVGWCAPSFSATRPPCCSLAQASGLHVCHAAVVLCHLSVKAACLPCCRVT